MPGVPASGIFLPIQDQSLTLITGPYRIVIVDQRFIPYSLLALSIELHDKGYQQLQRSQECL